ncbi:hepatocellular carcinoma-associated antigen 59-domain-containing protein [Amylostereum chailletii]|nr:hepatocellular carcinoma-associated antigen 59-domain-containing protein [Amylostereum chailletii]
MIKRRTRPTPQPRSISHEKEDNAPAILDDAAGFENEEEANLPVHELIELRKLRKARQGIDVSKLNSGDVKKRRKRKKEDEEEQAYGLQPGAKVDQEDEEDDKAMKARKAVRTNNFTQQTNVLDVDKHMMAYIEENMKLRRGQGEDAQNGGPSGSKEDPFRPSDRFKVEKKASEEGNVTNSLAMLTAIPEVDLGMDARLKNIEDTEKAKLLMSHGRKDRKKSDPNDEEHLAGTRFFRPNMRMKSDADIIRDAKLEAMGLPPEEDHHRPRYDRPQMATDEMVMERFKKRMRK